MTDALVKSVSVTNMVNQRAAVMAKIHQAIDLLGEASELAKAAGLGMPRVMISTSYSRHGDRDLCGARLYPGRAGARHELDPAARDDIARIVRLGVDASAWQYLMHESGMRSLMDATARKNWDKAIEAGDIPELTEPNVRSTFGMLHDSRAELFERGVIACFKSLAWCYKTNLPQKFGRRVVMTYLAGSYENADRLDDLVRVLSVLDGKPEPDHRSGVYALMSAAGLNYGPTSAGQVENDLIKIRTFKNRNGHVTFKRPDLVEKMNLIIAKHYPGALPAPK